MREPARTWSQVFLGLACTLRVPLSPLPTATQQARGQEGESEREKKKKKRKKKAHARAASGQVCVMHTPTNRHACKTSTHSDTIILWPWMPK